MNPTAVSVIIPVYNTERYLEQCLASVVSQTLRNIEIICINDGSSDNSLIILEYFASKDPRIQIITQRNLGSGHARNRGIFEASGEYIAFMDADDFYPATDILETLFQASKEHCVKICGGSLSEYRNDVVNTKFSEPYSKNIFQADGLISFRDYQYSLGYWRFIYNRMFLIENKILFPEIPRYQDPPFMALAFAVADGFYALSKISYCYRIGHKEVNWSLANVLSVIDGMSLVLKISSNYELFDLHMSIIDRLPYGRGKIFSCAMKEYGTIINDRLLAAQQHIRQDYFLARDGKEFDLLASIATDA